MKHNTDNALQTFIISSYQQSVCAGRLCMERCVRPLAISLQFGFFGNGFRRSNMLAALDNHIEEFQMIGDRVQKRFAKNALSWSGLSPEVQAKVSTSKHDLCNRLFQACFLLRRLKDLLGDLPEAGPVDSDLLSRIAKMAQSIEQWFEKINAVELVALSDVEPVIYLRKRFGNLHLIVEEKIPENINRCILNMILFHVVLNAHDHRSRDRKLNIQIRQTSSGVFVLDNGNGIKIKRLLEIKEAVSQGLAVSTANEERSGAGIRCAVMLLPCLFKASASPFFAELIVESWEGRGTRVSIIWDKVADRHLDEKHSITFSGAEAQMLNQMSKVSPTAWVFSSSPASLLEVSCVKACYPTACLDIDSPSMPSPMNLMDVVLGPFQRLGYEVGLRYWNKSSWPGVA